MPELTIDKNLPALPLKRGRKLGSTLEHTRRRRHEVMRMLLRGEPRYEIVEFIMNGHGVSEPSVTLDLQHCYAELKAMHSLDTQEMVLRHTAMCYRIFADWDKIDPSAQIKALDMINKMARIYAPETAVQVNNLSLNLEHLSIEELKQLLNDSNSPK